MQRKKKPTLSEQDIADALQEYRAFVRQYFEVDLTDMESIKSGNKAIKKMAKIAYRLRLPQHTDRFATLMEEQEYAIDIWAARHLLEHTDPNQEQVHRAVHLIEKHIEDKGTHANAEKLWLHNWKVQHLYAAKDEG